MEKSHFSSTFAVAFGNRIALTNAPVVVRATDASALPKNQQIFGGPVKCTFLLLRLGKMNYWLLLTNKKFVL